MKTFAQDFEKALAAPRSPTNFAGNSRRLFAQRYLTRILHIPIRVSGPPTFRTNARHIPFQRIPTRHTLTAPLAPPSANRSIGWPLQERDRWIECKDRRKEPRSSLQIQAHGNGLNPILLFVPGCHSFFEFLALPQMSGTASTQGYCVRQLVGAIVTEAEAISIMVPLDWWSLISCSPTKEKYGRWFGPVIRIIAQFLILSAINRSSNCRIFRRKIRNAEPIRAQHEAALNGSNRPQSIEIEARLHASNNHGKQQDDNRTCRQCTDEKYVQIAKHLAQDPQATTGR